MHYQMPDLVSDAESQAVTGNTGAMGNHRYLVFLSLCPDAKCISILKLRQRNYPHTKSFQCP